MRYPPLAMMLLPLVVACTGSLDERGVNNNNAAGGPDAGEAAACEPIAASAPGGHHNPGQPCQSCHAAGGSGPEFTLGGTLFDGLQSSTPITGATIVVTDDTGLEVKLTTADNGNFWTDRTLAYPITVAASGCPDHSPMVSAVQSSGADCNAGGCHVDTFRIHLP